MVSSDEGFLPRFTKLALLNREGAILCCCLCLADDGKLPCICNLQLVKLTVHKGLSHKNNQATKCQNPEEVTCIPPSLTSCYVTEVISKSIMKRHYGLSETRNTCRKEFPSQQKLKTQTLFLCFCFKKEGQIWSGFYCGFY